MKKLFLFSLLVVALVASYAFAHNGNLGTNPAGDRAHAHLDAGNVKAAVYDWGMNGNSGESGAVGFKYPKIGGTDYGYSGTLMVGVPGTEEEGPDVADSYGGTDGGDDVWVTSEGGDLMLYDPGEIGQQDSWAMYENELTTASGATMVTVTERGHIWAHYDYDDFVIMEYTVKNTGEYTMEDVFIGYMWDWDVGSDYSNNLVGYDEALNTSYVWEDGNTIYTGTTILNETPYSATYVDNPNEIYDYSDILDENAYMKMSTPGFSDDFGPTDVSSIISVGPYVIAPGDSVEIVVAFVAGETWDDFATHVSQAQWAYDNDWDVPELPPKPTNLMAEVQNMTDIALNWDEPTYPDTLTLTGYQVYRKHEAGDYGMLIQIDDPAVTSYLDEDVEIEGGVFSYYVVALYGEDGASGGSDPASAELVNFIASPENLQATVGGGDVMLEWSEPAPGLMRELMNDNGSAAVYSSGWDIGYVVASHLELEEERYTYPLTLKKIKCSFYDYGAVGTHDVILHIYDIGESGMPGEELYVSDVITNTTFYGSWAEFDISDANIVVDGPFFAAVEYASGEPGTIPSVLLDSQGGNVESGKNYYYAPDSLGEWQWMEHYSYWGDPAAIGYNMLRTIVKTSVGETLVLDSNSDSKANPLPVYNGKRTQGSAVAMEIPEQDKVDMLSVPGLELTFYKVYRKQEGGSYQFLPPPLGPEIMEKADTPGDGTWYYHVIALYDYNGVQYESEPSNEVMVQLGEQIIFEEGFEGETIPEGWQNIDNDGDGYMWFLYEPEPHGGMQSIASASWISSEGALTPDNWLITPQIDLSAGALLRYWVAAQDPDWSGENYQVAISTTGTNVPDDFTVIFEETLPMGSNEWYGKELDLSDYGDDPVYVAFVHTNITDMFYIKIDDVQVVVPDGVFGEDNNVAVPQKFAVSQNYPNPFNPVTNISFTIPYKTTVALNVYNANGQLVKSLVNGEKEADHYTVQWNGKDNDGKAVSSGVYFYTIKAGDYETTKRMVLLK